MFHLFTSVFCTFRFLYVAFCSFSHNLSVYITCQFRSSSVSEAILQLYLILRQWQFPSLYCSLSLVIVNVVPCKKYFVCVSFTLSTFCNFFISFLLQVSTCTLHRPLVVLRKSFGLSTLPFQRIPLEVRAVYSVSHGHEDFGCTDHVNRHRLCCCFEVWFNFISFSLIKVAATF